MHDLYPMTRFLGGMTSVVDKSVRKEEVDIRDTPRRVHVESLFRVT